MTDLESVEVRGGGKETRLLSLVPLSYCAICNREMYSFISPLIPGSESSSVQNVPCVP